VLRFFAPFLFILSGSPNLAAAQLAPDPAKQLQRMDSNGDGRIAQREWQGPPQAFRKLDLNGDGFLTSEELEQGAGRSQAAAPTQNPAPATAGTASLAWVDTHVHLRRGNRTYEAALDHAVELMNGANLRSAVVMPPPFPSSGRAQNRYDAPELSRLTKAFPGRFIFLGGGSLINGIIESTPPDQVTEAIRADFAGKAASILDAGARGFGEMGMMHMGHFPGHPSYWVSPDHPLFLLLADIAGARRAIIDVHMDVVERDAATPKKLARGNNPPQMKANIAAFERFVAHNRDARIILAHAGWDVTGQWSAALSRRLLEAHPNLYFSLKTTTKGASGENRLMTGSSPATVAAAWLTVLEDFPDRFVIGSDSFFAAANAKGGAPGGMTQFHGDYSIAALLAALPQDLARRIASENALALYGTP
jgi:Amidohydrolase/EF hand